MRGYSKAPNYQLNWDHPKISPVSQFFSTARYKNQDSTSRLQIAPFSELLAALHKVSLWEVSAHFSRDRCRQQKYFFPKWPSGLATSAEEPRMESEIQPCAEGSLRPNPSTDEPCSGWKCVWCLCTHNMQVLSASETWACGCVCLDTKH